MPNSLLLYFTTKNDNKKDCDVIKVAAAVAAIDSISDFLVPLIFFSYKTIFHKHKPEYILLHSLKISEWGVVGNVVRLSDRIRCVSLPPWPPNLGERASATMVP